MAFLLAILLFGFVPKLLDPMSLRGAQQRGNLNLFSQTTGVTPLLSISFNVSTTRDLKPEWPRKWQFIRLRMAAQTTSMGKGFPYPAAWL